MKAQFEELYQGQNLSRADAKARFDEMFRGGMSDVQLASLFTALKMKGETPDEIGGAASAMVNAARVFPKHGAFEIGEIVGTGGDGQATINVSTTAALARFASLGRIAVAGGLHDRNVGELSRRLPAPMEVDVNSGVESAPGIKSRTKHLAFFEAPVGASAPQAQRRPRPSNRSRMLNPSL